MNPNTEPQTFEEKWQAYAKMCFTEDMPPIRLKWQKRSFYTGAFVTLLALKSARKQLSNHDFKRFLEYFYNEIDQWHKEQVALDASERN